MARKVFFSFYYKEDNWRAAQVRNIGAIEGNQPASDNDWEKVKGGGDSAIGKWIKQQLEGKSCTLVLVGTNTAGRKWINYEIETAWNSGKGVLGIHIHGLKDASGNQSSKGKNPFVGFSCKNGKQLSSILKVYDTPYATSQYVYDHIAENISDWIEEAIRIRANQ